MSEITSYLDTITPDLENVLKLFGLPPVRLADMHWQLTADEQRYLCHFKDGETEAAASADIPPATGDERLDTLHRRRAARRLCRQILYLLCKKMTGMHPPWGSLTGIRPTRLIYEQLEAGIPLDAASENLVSRFDVLPEKATLLKRIVSVQQTLPPPGDAWMDVYIGIPFCTTRCAYCSFSSGEIGNGRLVAPYLAALKRELEAGAALIAATGRQLRALYIGGGTPTALNAEQLRELLAVTLRLMPNAMEYTVEAGRPDTLTPEKLHLIREMGIGRISINPQSMVDRTLQAIGRAHTAAQVEAAYSMARAAGIGHINMDVIAGLPGESLEDFAVTMKAARRLHPESLTVHALAIKRATRLHLDQTPLPGAEVAAAMTAMGQETAAELGLVPYYLYRQKYMAGNQENVGYALPGHACLYNVDIMEENTHILAFGAGGISKRIYPEEGHIERAPNVSNIEQYISRVEEMIARKQRLFGLADGFEGE